MSGALGAAAYGHRFSGAPNYMPTAGLITPTYDGSGVTTEPTWILKPSWVTATGTDLLSHNPLTGGSADVENPSLLISNDQGATWSTPIGLTNPIYAKPSADGQPGNNEDCHIVADPNSNRLIMTWHVAGFQSPNVALRGIYMSTCTDSTLVTWSAGSQIIADTGTFEPKLVWDAPGHRWVMFTALNADPGTLYMNTTGTNPLTGWGTAGACTLTIPGGRRMWHMDIKQETSGRYVMAFSDKDSPQNGWLASSWNGVNWQCSPRRFVKAVPATWGSAGVYRPSLLISRSGSGYDMIAAREQAVSSQLGLTRNIPATEIP